MENKEAVRLDCGAIWKGAGVERGGWDMTQIYIVLFWARFGSLCKFILKMYDTWYILSKFRQYERFVCYCIAQDEASCVAAKRRFKYVFQCGLLVSCSKIRKFENEFWFPLGVTSLGHQRTNWLVIWPRTLENNRWTGWNKWINEWVWKIGNMLKPKPKL